LVGDIRTEREREKNDLIGPLIIITGTHTDRQQCDLISLLLFFKIREAGLKHTDPRAAAQTTDCRILIQESRFNPSGVHVSSAVNGVALRHVSSTALQFPLPASHHLVIT
jgi:hypothetical protein